MKRHLYKIAAVTALNCITLVSQSQLDPTYRSLGAYLSHQTGTSSITLKAANGQASIEFYSPSAVRVRITQAPPPPSFSYSLIAQPQALAGLVRQENSPATLRLITDSLVLEVHKKPLRFRLLSKAGVVVNEDEPAFGSGWMGQQPHTYKKMQPQERFIGLGEKTGPLDRKGQGYTNWNTDYFGYPTNADEIYQSLPFYIGLHSGVVYGVFFDNSYRSHFNFGASNDRFASFTAEGGEIDYYLMHRSTPAGVIEEYTRLTGRMELPPLWSLGYQQCRYSYYPDAEVIRTAQTFREKKIPADVIYLDIHYMDAYKIFTWHPTRFPNPQGMLSQLKDLGFHTTVIIDPGIKVEKGYNAYEQGLSQNLFLKYPDGTPYTGQVWPGWCHFPDFTQPTTRQWWGDRLSDLTRVGIDGFWNDMNEPATWGQRFPDLVEFDFEGRKGTHQRGHNLYGLLMSRASYEGAKRQLAGQRPFNLTRAGFSGIQRYAAVWTGDNLSTDDHFLAGIRLVNSMGLTGVPFTGYDVGGFSGGSTRELFARWISVGAFTPFFRVHSAIDTKENDPFSYGETVEAICRNYIQLRYNLMPYLYGAFEESSRSGIPIARSMALNYPHDPLIYRGTYENQFLCGPSLLVAPVSSERDVADVYLPPGQWYDLYSDKPMPAGQHLVRAPLSALPVFVKGGAIVPMQSPVQYTGQKPTDTLFVHVYHAPGTSSYTYYEDDGRTYTYQQGQYHRRTYTLNATERTLSLSAAQGSFASHFKYVQLVFHGFTDLKATATSSGATHTWEPRRIEVMPGIPGHDPLGTLRPVDTRPPLPTVTLPHSAEGWTLAW